MQMHYWKADGFKFEPRGEQKMEEGVSRHNFCGFLRNYTQVLGGWVTFLALFVSSSESGLQVYEESRWSQCYIDRLQSVFVNVAIVIREEIVSSQES